MPRKYNKNITLIKIVNKPTRLKKNEYYALMVTDLYNRHNRPKSDYWDFRLGYLGLERTSDGEIYVSKNFSARRNLSRGETFVVKITKKAKVLKLTE